jgi:hypothetical protein
MNSEATGAPFRGAPPGPSTSIVVRYMPLVWSQPAALLVLASLFVWALWGESGMQLMKHVAGMVAFLALVALPRFPLLTVRATLDAGHLTVTGQRWPGPQVIWSCPAREAEGFGITLDRDEKSRDFRCIVLRTTDGKVYALTQAYPGGKRAHDRALAKLTAWWNAASPK